VLVVLTEQLGGHSSTLWRIDEEQRRAYLQLVCQNGSVVTAQNSGHPNANEPQEWADHRRSPADADARLWPMIMKLNARPFEWANGFCPGGTADRSQARSAWVSDAESTRPGGTVEVMVSF
jgi:hypothetical protein